MKQATTMLATVLVAAIAAAGCGSDGKDIDSVGSCLEELGLNVEAAPSEDEDVEEGVFATTDLSAGNDPAEGEGDEDAADEAADQFTFALAARVGDESSIDEFEEQSREFAKSASADDKLQFESGTDGTYVWVAGGEQGSDAFDDVRGCVEP